MNEPQPREDNGRYGQKTHSPPEVPLAEEVHGSFLFPPDSWNGVDDYLTFWKTQPISDDALTNFVSAYAADWDEWAVPLIREHLHDWGNGEGGLQARREAGDDKDKLWRLREAEADAFEARLELTRPRRIKSGLVRHVARAAQIIQNRSSLRTEEDQAEAGRAVMYYNADNEPWTAAELWDRYRLSDIMPDAFYSRENKLQRELRELRRTLTQ